MKSWILKKYKDESGHELELVHEQAAAQYGYPLSLWTWDEPLREKLNSALYVASETGNVSPAKDLSFEYADGDLVVKKDFHFDNSYVVGVKTSVRRGGSYVTALPAWPAGIWRRHRAAELRGAAPGLRCDRRRREAPEAGQKGCVDQRRTRSDRQLPVGRRLRRILRRDLPSRAAAERLVCRVAQRDRDSQGSSESAGRKGQGRSARRRRRNSERSVERAACLPVRKQ